MMFPRRTQCPQSYVPYPVANSELAPCVSPEPLASPPTTPPRGHKRSFSKAMIWLNRSSSSTSCRSVPQPANVQPHPTPKPIRISEPKISNSRSFDQFTSCRSGRLGSGATIVRTPQEALETLSGAPHTSDLISERALVKGDTLLRNTEKNDSRILSQSPPSPPLPPLPDIPDADGESRHSGSSTSVSLSDHVAQARSSGSPTLVPHPSPPVHSRTLSRSAPNLLVDTTPVPQQPPFEAILLSSVPDGGIDSSKLIVVLETCSTTFRTSLRSLTSRQSYLSRYITSLLSPVSEEASVCSNTSDTSSARHNDWFNSLLHDHLTSAGCLAQSSSAIHVFLDRPSSPYTHILAYLRSLPSTPDQPETLPRAVQLGSSRPSQSRIESLLELRDEACYLGLVELEKLCSHEINRFHHRSALPASPGAALGGKRTGSVRSFRTVVDRCLSRQESRPPEIQVLPKADSGTRIPTETKTIMHVPRSSVSSENKEALLWVRGSKQRVGVKHEVGSPPPGWI